jgi:hypothetical protein
MLEIAARQHSVAVLRRLHGVADLTHTTARQQSDRQVLGGADDINNPQVDAPDDITSTCELLGYLKLLASNKWFLLLWIGEVDGGAFRIV